MALPRSKRSSVSSQSSAKSSGSASTASSVPSERSGYVEDASADGTRTSFKTIRYRRIRFPHAEAIGKPVYYLGHGKECITKGEMRRKTDALAIDRVENARKRALRACKRNATTTLEQQDSVGRVGTDAREKLEYVGFVIEVLNIHIFGRSAQVLTSAGMLETTVAKHYRDSTLPNVGTLIYKRSGQLGTYDLIAKKDPQYFGCIVQLSTPYSRPANTTVTTTAGRRVDMQDHQLCNPDDSRVGSLVCRLPGDGRYVVQAGK